MIRANVSVYNLMGQLLYRSKMNNTEKVFGLTKAWADENPNTHIAVVKALIRAGKWLDATDSKGNLINRKKACRILSKKNYVGADYDVLKNSMNLEHSRHRSPCNERT